ncbi:MAG: hypothetical protein ACRDIV_04735 [Ktedonobacteraceae bacterium]
MSKLTSMVKSGKRMIIQTRTGFRTTTKTALGLPDRGVSQDPLRPEHEALLASNMTSLGLPDQGVSQDPLRPQDDTPSSSNMTALGRSDQKVAHDAMEPQDDTGTRA